MLRIHVDFNSIFDDPDPRERVSINTIYRPEYLEHLKPGLPATFYDSESMECDGVIEFDERYQAWLGVLDWSTRRDLPPLPQDY